MRKYKLLKTTWGAVSLSSIQRLSDGAFIPVCDSSSDFASFKDQINADEAQLESADGIPMTSEEAKSFVATLTAAPRGN